MSAASATASAPNPPRLAVTRCVAIPGPFARLTCVPPAMRAPIKVPWPEEDLWGPWAFSLERVRLQIEGGAPAPPVRGAGAIARRPRSFQGHQRSAPPTGRPETGAQRWRAGSASTDRAPRRDAQPNRRPPPPGRAFGPGSGAPAGRGDPAPRGMPAVVQQVPIRRPVQPTLDLGGAALDAAAGADQLQEGVLRQVLGEVVILSLGREIAHQGRGEDAPQRGEGVRVTGPYALCQLLVERHGRVHACCLRRPQPPS